MLKIFFIYLYTSIIAFIWTGMHVILDFIPNHTSNQSDWFQHSMNDTRGPYSDYYIWRKSNGTNDDGEEIPPNDWVCFSSWKSRVVEVKFFWQF